MSRLLHILMLSAFLVGAVHSDTLAQDMGNGGSEQPVALHAADVPTAKAIQPVGVVLHPIPVAEQWVPGTFSHLFRGRTTSQGSHDARGYHTTTAPFRSLPLYDLLHVYRC